MKKEKCHVCDGSGGSEYTKCPHCKGKGKIDWVENIIGAKPNMVRPGVYVREVDLSERVPRFNSSILDQLWLEDIDDR